MKNKKLLILKYARLAAAKMQDPSGPNSKNQAQQMKEIRKQLEMTHEQIIAAAAKLTVPM